MKAASWIAAAVGLLVLSAAGALAFTYSGLRSDRAAVDEEARGLDAAFDGSLGLVPSLRALVEAHVGDETRTEQIALETGFALARNGTLAEKNEFTTQKSNATSLPAFLSILPRTTHYRELKNDTAFVEWQAGLTNATTAIAEHKARYGERVDAYNAHRGAGWLAGLVSTWFGFGEAERIA